MPRIKFIAFDGAETVIDAESGLSLMNNAVNHGVPGIVAECGGACACATCHVHVAAEWYGKLPAPEGVEIDMLELATERKDNSRLSCQIKITGELDGMVVHTPESQY